MTFPHGLLLHGPPGVGKTAAVLQVARECGALVQRIDPGDVIGSTLGESERRLREAWADARGAAAADPSRAVVLLLDEADALCARRSPQRPHEARIVGQLLTLMDGAEGRGTGEGHLIVVGTTSAPDALDPALRRPGRFDREVALPVPDGPARGAILAAQARGLPLAPGTDLAAVARDCFGYSGADLAALCREAAMLAVARCTPETAFENGGMKSDRGAGQAPSTVTAQEGAATFASGPETSSLLVSAEDFDAARTAVGPSIGRGLTLDFVPLSWNDIGGLEDVKKQLRQAIEWPLQHGEAYARLGLRPPRGVLMHGPPGCSKTTLARAVATSSRATFVSLSAAQLFSQYVGEGEALLRRAFQRARLAAPAIIFLDEVDVLVGKRTEGEQTQEAVARLLSTFLTEMDGLEGTDGVLVLGATNRPYAIDDAMLRPGRFDVIVFVPPPDAAGREAVLRIHSRAMPLAGDVDFHDLAQQAERFTGAELAQVCREAALGAVREAFWPVQEQSKAAGPALTPAGMPSVTHAHFIAALREVRPALTPDQLVKAAAWRRQRGETQGGAVPAQ